MHVGAAAWGIQKPRAAGLAKLPSPAFARRPLVHPPARNGEFHIRPNARPAALLFDFHLLDFDTVHDERRLLCVQQVRVARGVRSCGGKSCDGASDFLARVVEWREADERPDRAGDDEWLFQKARLVTAALIGFFGGRAGSSRFRVGGGHDTAGEGGLQDRDSLLGERMPVHARPNRAWSLKVSAIFLALWLTPVALLLLTLGVDDVFTQIATFFSRMAVVTFGGAYAVLSYVAQAAVQNYGWLAPGEMLDGLGMAETTPGPLIQVVQFVGFMGAFRDAGALDPWLAATLAAVLTTWVTFVPCFLWIFLGAPYVERLRDNAALSGAMTAITAAVVGVVLNLAVWFGIHVVFAEVGEWRGAGLRLLVPEPASLDPFALLLSAGAMLAIFRFRVGMLKVLGVCASTGMLLSLLG